ncbi:MAG: zinc transporter ZupT [Sphaerochaeta sp.]|jgi:ZIP family zinc transporter|nr:zinc transporter ZupT [Sphaerochaeta sp.]MDX9916280.1 zinc transporter ZupT [Sphaerochaeta sp.]
MYTIDATTLGIAFGLTLFAGLSTGIGSLMSFFSKEFNPKFLAASLGFSAGVMIYVSLIEIFVKARIALEGVLGPRRGYLMTTIAFFVGIVVIALIDKLIPDAENPHEIPTHPEGEREAHNQKLMRMGFFSALAIAIHNFPEGLATFMAAISDPALGVSIAIAIALHNIPEGVAVSVPIYYATQSRKKAFLYGTLSGLAEPVGAFVGFFLLRRWFNDLTFGFVFASIAGIMVYISLDELLPTAEEYGEHHIAIGGVMAGMVVMAISLVLLAPGA